MGNIIKIAAVSYLNTFPFLYGMQKSEFIKNNSELILAYPSECARLLLNKEVNMALVPTGIIPQLKISYIISKYCIGSENKVKSVVLASRVPLKKIREVYLDYQSATSIRLVRILANYYWDINPVWKQSQPGYERLISDTTAGVIIGDRNFVNTDYEYIYDLGEEWNKFTSLPFVYAVWLSVKPVDPDFKKEFNNALSIGIQDIDGVCDFYKKRITPGLDAKKYYTENISYFFNDEKSRGMNSFLKYVRLENQQENVLRKELYAQK